MYYYSKDEKLYWVKKYYAGNSLHQIRTLFAFDYPDSPVPNVSTISKTLKILDKTGSVTSSKNKPAPRSSNEENNLDIMVCAMVEATPTMSSRKIATELDISHFTVLQILKRNKYKSFKFSKSQELFADDFYRRMEFCEKMVDLIHNDDSLIDNILFTDESTFELHTAHNSQNIRYWSRQNLYLSIPIRSQYPQKLNVWSGYIGKPYNKSFFYRWDIKW